MDRYKEIEQTIIKKYRKEIWAKFIKGIKDYNLVEENDKIAVCISGGKDSFLLAKLFQELKRHGKIPFEVEYIVMDPGYNKINHEKIEENAKLLNIPIHIFKSDIFEVTEKNTNGKPCYLCARMRRGFLYSKAKELGCNKIALGHHYDDVIETIMLNLFYGGEFKTMMPKLHSTNFEGLELIRPMYFIREKYIIAWKNYNNLDFINCACRFTEKCSNDDNDSKRLEVKKLIADLRRINPNIENNIFKCSDNVNLDAIIGYKVDGEKHSFLDDYK